MKKLLLLLLTVTTVTLSQAQCRYNFHFGYVGYMTKGQPNLNGFRAAYWPQEYRFNRYRNSSNSLANWGNRNTVCFSNDNSIVIFGDFVFTVPDENKANEFQAVTLGFIMPIFPPALNFHLGAGNKWNNGIEDEFYSEFTAVYGLTYISPGRGITISLGRQTKSREMFARTGGHTTLSIGYTLKR